MAPSSEKCFWPPRSGWLYKARRGDAWGKWLQPCRRRYFTVDFRQQVLFYSRRQGGQGVSEPIPFANILGAESCKIDDDSVSKSLSIGSSSSYKQSLCKFFASQRFYFVLQTTDRTFQLASETDEEADIWIEMLNAAQRMGKACSSVPHTELSGGSKCVSEIEVRRSCFDELRGQASCHMSQRASIRVMKALDQYVDLEFDLSDTVHMVKLELQQRKGFELDQQCLHFDDKRLENRKTLNYYGIQNGSVLRLLLRIYTRTEKRWIELMDRLLIADSKARSKGSQSIMKTDSKRLKWQRARDSSASHSSKKCQNSSQIDLPPDKNSIVSDGRSGSRGRISDSVAVGVRDTCDESKADITQQKIHNRAIPDAIKSQDSVASTRRRATKLPDFKKRSSVAATTAP